MALDIYIINGPNLNLLGEREPEIYGDHTLETIINFTNKKVKSQYPELSLHWLQSNIEGEIVNFLQEARNAYGVVINPAGYSHTSVSISDTLKLLTIPKVEVHLSKVGLREEFRQKRITATGCDVTIEGTGKFAYLLGIEYIQLLKATEE